MVSYQVIYVESIKTFTLVQYLESKYPSSSNVHLLLTIKYALYLVALTLGEEAKPYIIAKLKIC